MPCKDRKRKEDNLSARIKKTKTAYELGRHDNTEAAT
jgi:hypothetical protein